MSKYPIPIIALDDRLAFVGTAGAGKTNAAAAGVECVLDAGARVMVTDPLDVWWGLRLSADGERPSKYKPVIFGGAHADLPLNEHAGALLGEAVATMAESCIVSMGGLGTKAAERRFMLGFLTALYRHASGEPVHLVFDEADMWAPQRLLDKDGDAAKLLGMMETVVRRGRVKGFIPWLITQRPAVLSKDVLSQADGLIALKLTSSQDRDAIGGWIEGQGDRQDGKRLLASLPGMQRGQGALWIPARGILDTVQFPLKHTFDSSRTPKRGEVRRRADLKPIDISALKGKLATVEAEAKANDPRELKVEIARLQEQMRRAAASAAQGGAIPDPAALAEADKQGYARGMADGAASIVRQYEPIIKAISEHTESIRELLTWPANIIMPKAVSPERPSRQATPDEIAAKTLNREFIRTYVQRANGTGQEKMSAAMRAFLTVLAQQKRPLTRDQIAVFAGYSSRSGHVDSTISACRTAGYAEGPGSAIQITGAGIAALGHYEPLPTGRALQEYWFGTLDKAPAAFLRVLCDEYPKPVTRDALAERAGYSAASGHVDSSISALRTRMLAQGPGSALKASDELFR